MAMSINDGFFYMMASDALTATCRDPWPEEGESPRCDALRLLLCSAMVSVAPDADDIPLPDLSTFYDDGVLDAAVAHLHAQILKHLSVEAKLEMAKILKEMAKEEKT